MGIQGFTRYILNNSNAINVSYDLKKNNKYDFLILDFQSSLYTYYQILYSEINYFIRILFCLKYNLEGMNSKYSNWTNILNYIINTHYIYFNILYNVDELKKMINMNNFDDILNLNFNDEQIICDTLINYIVNYTQELSINLVSNKYEDKYSRTYIFFDGIPSLAKIKEQIGRRLYPTINKYIINDYLNKKKLKNIDIDISEKEIRTKLLMQNPPAIGINSYTTNNIRYKLSNIKDPNLGKFNINNKNNYGEAEHQMMLYIKQKEIFKNSNILLSSPDADLIILALINNQNNITIDIINDHQILIFENGNKYEYKNINNNIISPFRREYYYVDILKVKKFLKIYNNTSLNDICFILLLLGDDFLPIIPSIDVNSINDMINIYNKLNIQIINNNKTINYHNFQLYIYNLYKIVEKNDNIILSDSDNINECIENYEFNHHQKYYGETYIMNKYNRKFVFEKYRKVTDELYKMQDLYKIHPDNNILNIDIDTFNDLFYLSEGIWYYNNKCYNLFRKKKHTEFSTNQKIINYLEGCNFILDLYFNHRIRNIKWIYNYETSPKLKEISDFLFKINKMNKINLHKNFGLIYDNNTITFPIFKKNDNFYFDINKYNLFLNKMKHNIYINILYNLGYSKEENNDDINKNMQKYITYDNVDKIYDCTNQSYINRCIPYKMLIPKSKDYIKTNKKNFRIKIISGIRYIKFNTLI